MDTCNICGQNSLFSVCKNCSLKGCQGCINDHHAFCELLRKEKCHLCKIHDHLVKGYCCQCCQLACKDCFVDNHMSHSIIPILEAMEKSEGDFVKFKEVQIKISSYVKTCTETRNIYHAIEEQIKESEEGYQRIIQIVKAELLSQIEEMKEQIKQQCEVNETIRPYLDWPNITAERFPMLLLSQFSEARLHLDHFQSHFMRYVIPTDDLNSIQNIHQLFLNRMMELDSPKASSSNTSNVTGVDYLSVGFQNISFKDEERTESMLQQSVVSDNGIEDLKVKVDELSFQISELEKEKTYMLQCLEKMPTLVNQINDMKGLSEPLNFGEYENNTINWFTRSVESLINKIIEFKNRLIQSEADVDTKIAEITSSKPAETRTNYTEIEPNLKVFQQDIHFKEKKIKCLEEQLSELQVKDRLLEQEAYKIQCNWTEHLHTVDKEKHDMKLRLETADQTIFQSEQKIIALKNTIQQMQIASSQRDDLVNTMKREKDDVQNRLSKIAGEKLTKGNPAITDLGDPNRPMKLAEMYSGLYDNEWTDAMDCSGLKELFPESKNSETEEIIVRHLYKILTACYEECLQLSKEQCMSIAQIIQCDSNQGENNISNLPGCMDLASIRRQNSEKFAQYLLTNKILYEKILTSPWYYLLKNTDLMKHLLETPFFAKCVKLCWSMVIQEPAMYLSENLLSDTVYDKNVYKEFVQSGDKVTYVVWPALFLHKNGPLLYKGVVQAHK